MCGRSQKDVQTLGNCFRFHAYIADRGDQAAKSPNEDDDEDNQLKCLETEVLGRRDYPDLKSILQQDNPNDEAIDRTGELVYALLKDKQQKVGGGGGDGAAVGEPSNPESSRSTTAATLNQ